MAVTISIFAANAEIWRKNWGIGKPEEGKMAASNGVVKVWHSQSVIFTFPSSSLTQSHDIFFKKDLSKLLSTCVETEMSMFFPKDSFWLFSYD